LSPKLQNLKHRGTEAAEEMKLDERMLCSSSITRRSAGSGWANDSKSPLFPLLLRVLKVLAAG
jgi:hypothetical protein